MRFPHILHFPFGKPFGVHFGFFGFQFEGLGCKSEAWEALLESILGLVRVWEAKRHQGRGPEGLGQGVAGDPDLDPTWLQLEPSRSQLGANMGPR